MEYTRHISPEEEDKTLNGHLFKNYLREEPNGDVYFCLCYKGQCCEFMVYLTEDKKIVHLPMGHKQHHWLSSEQDLLDDGYRPYTKEEEVIFDDICCSKTVSNSRLMLINGFKKGKINDRF